MRLGCKRRLAPNIRFPEVATGAKRLEVLKNGETAVAPRGNVVDVKLDPRGKCGTRSAGAAREPVTLQDTPAQAQRGVPSSLFARNGEPVALRILNPAVVRVLDEMRRERQTKRRIVDDTAIVKWMTEVAPTPPAEVVAYSVAKEPRYSRRGVHQKW